MGVRYWLGRSVPKDPEKGAMLVTPAAEQGYEQAQYSLDMIYLMGRDFKKTRKWLTLAAKSQAMLGLMHEHGEGGPQNGKMAVKWYTLAAEQGDLDAKESLDKLLLN